MERQYFFPETEAQKVTAEILPNPMTRTEATDYIDTIRKRFAILCSGHGWNMKQLTE